MRRKIKVLFINFGEFVSKIFKHLLKNFKTKKRHLRKGVFEYSLSLLK